MKLPFENIFVINLDSRLDRLVQITAESKRIGFEFERISAIGGGVTGCRASHLLCAKLAQQRNLKNYLVLEDDAQFAENFNMLFEQLYPSVPTWDMLYLGAEHQSLMVKQTEGVVRCQSSYKLHATAVDSGFYNTFIETLESTGEPCDIAIAKVHKNFFVYSFYPAIVWQRESYSDLAGRVISYGQNLDN